MQKTVHALPKYIALDTAECLQDYLESMRQLIDYSPIPDELGFELICAVETKQYNECGIDSFARDAAIAVGPHGAFIDTMAKQYAKNLAQEVCRQIATLNLYVSGELVYTYKGWVGKQLLLVRLSLHHLTSIITDPYFKEDIDELPHRYSTEPEYLTRPLRSPVWGHNGPVRKPDGDKWF